MARARGEGTITKHPKGWAGAVTMGYDGKGRRKRRWVYGKTQKEVLKKLEALKKQLEEGSYAEPSRVTLDGFMGKFLEAKGRSAAARTVEMYEDVHRLYLSPRLGGMKLQKLSPLQIEEALTDITRRVSPDAASKARSILFRVTRQAVKWGLLTRNPVEAVATVRVERKKAKVWTPREAALFLTYAKTHRLYAAFYLTLACGLRRGEVLGLKWEDLTPGGLHVRNNLVMVGNRPLLKGTKTEAGIRFVPYAPDAHTVLMEHKERQQGERAESAIPWPQTGLVFTSLVGTPMNPHNFTRTWYALQDKANGLEEALSASLKGVKGREERRAVREKVQAEFAARRLPLHGLRRTFATWEIALNGADPKTLAAKLGHTRASFTLDVYAQQFAEARQAQALSLADVLPKISEVKN